MSHRCGSGCYRKQGRRSECPTCSKINQKRSRLRYAKRVMGNPTGHYLLGLHPDVKKEWIERTLTEPFYQETHYDGREVYYGAVPEMQTWLRVVIDGNQLHTAYLDKRLIKRWGRPL